MACVISSFRTLLSLASIACSLFFPSRIQRMADTSFSIDRPNFIRDDVINVASGGKDKLASVKLVEGAGHLVSTYLLDGRNSGGKEGVAECMDGYPRHAAFTLFPQFESRPLHRSSTPLIHLSVFQVTVTHPKELASSIFDALQITGASLPPSATKSESSKSKM